ncbi:helix-turn-helix transcriptional regulator [Candidatus Protofrankia californiensis]|uniref:helix-turn-helix transcriptional regulator n=1 Tax=Candidatus Protofrankia californiensis TaxID=1839754 RepID=UPI0019D2A986|nr:helix-turn-helix transcriptional regulator [Candidatus Protofrankia californiensis]
MPKPTLGSRASAVREGVADLCEQRVDPDDLVHEVAERLRRVVPYDSGTWMTSDPETLLPTGLHTVGLIAGVHAEEIRNELAGTDVNRFVDLDRCGHSAVSLAAATGGEVGRSARHRLVYAPIGLRDELRLLARAGSATWGMGCLISRHTVRDHVKSIFAKVAVTSRPELTAALGAEGAAVGREGDACHRAQVSAQ